ncbi:phytoene desaturase family protein [Subtercola endophyticus]|uniref:phytoene desaturase family protein n=1 Tax=Subtercola endophyticus TaxID=2895559 RepID=UPI001E418495|nr:phytoene desaturase family protein [Subtercola endophyticus]UFS61192.1 phytoene desaturase [Subtercola endophyticus]
MLGGAKPHAVVIGAGISGLAAAGLLAREGYRVTVVEKRDQVGGRAGLWEKDGFRFDTGPSWYLMPEVFDHFYRLMGTTAADQLDLQKLDPGYRVHFQDEHNAIDIAASRDENLELFESLEPGSGVRMAGYLDSAAETYMLAKEYFLYSTFEDLRPLLKGPVARRSPRLVRLLVESLNSFAGRTVRDPRLLQILGYPAVFLGSSPYSTPSMYHLMSHLDLDDGVLYPQGGLNRVIETITQLAIEAGVEIVTGAAVSRIVTTDDEAEAVAAAPPVPAPGPYDYDTHEFDTNVIDRDELRRVLEGEVEYDAVRHGGAASTTQPAVAGGSSSGGPAGSAASTTAGSTTGGEGTTKSRAVPARVSGIQYLDDAGTAHSLDADIVVAAADLEHVETTMLLPELQTYPASYWAKKTAGPSAVLIYLGVSGELPELLHHTLFFTKSWKEDFTKIFGKTGIAGLGKRGETSVPSPASIYVCRPSATDASVAPEGSENLFVLVPIPADPGIGHGGENGTGSPQVEAIADEAIAQIASWAGVPDLVSRITVRRTVGPADFASDLNAWNGTALGPAHTLGQSAFFRAGNVSKKVQGLYYAGGSTIPGIGLPMCLISAELVIKRLRGDTSTTALPEPPLSPRPAPDQPPSAAPATPTPPAAAPDSAATPTSATPDSA